MNHRLVSCSMISLLVIDLILPLKIQAEHKNGLINRFCIATIKSKLKSNNKDMINEISHFTCNCFMKQYKSGSSIKNSRLLCKRIAEEKYNL